MSFVIISTPFRFGVVSGGFTRNSKVVPYLTRLLRNYTNNIILYIPAGILRIGAELLSRNLNIPIEDAYEVLYKDLKSFILENNINKISIELLNLSIPRILSYDIKLNNLSKLNKLFHDKVIGFGPFYVFEHLHFENIDYLINSVDLSIGVYSTGENLGFLYPLYKISKGLHSFAFLLIQLQLLYDRIITYSTLFNSFKNPRRLIRNVSFDYFNMYVEHLLKGLLRSNLLKLILGVSPAVFLSQRFLSMVKRYGAKLSVPFPANAVDEWIFRFRKVEGKDDLAVFFARLTPNKGIFELLRAWKIIEDMLPNAKLRIMGMFESEKHRTEFFKLMSKLNLRNVEFLGFVKDREELYRLVSEAKVLIYPSHEDSYSLTILEALSLGNAVVAYGIPAIRWVYSGLPNVRIVREGDYKALARESIKILRMPEREYVELHENDVVRRFLELHSSWENVARTEFNLLRPYIEESLGRVRR